MRRMLSAALGAVVFAATAGGPEAAQIDRFHPPAYCQKLDDLGVVITIPWSSEGCHADRDAFALRIVDHRNRPGFYPPLACSASGAVYDWPSPACAHARNLYARRKIRAIYFGARPLRRS
jgi:hypothetical protein